MSRRCHRPCFRSCRHRDGWQGIAFGLLVGTVCFPVHRTGAAELPSASTVVDYQTEGVVDLSSGKGGRMAFPIFYERLLERMHFPLSWLEGGHGSFEEWRQKGREVFHAHLMDAPTTAPFAPRFFDEQDRGTHRVCKVAFNLTGDSRVLGYLALPKGTGPFPAMLLMHDHSGKFDIGKEKMIRPWNAGAERVESARAFAERVYGGRFVGDELAARGYVCLAVDALNWGDRGGGTPDDQQSLASNLMHMGMTFAGLIAHEDLRAAEFLASLPEVDPARIGTVGLSMGAHRAWQAAALSDRIAAGAAICWMATVKGLMQGGYNRARGQSAYTMNHPGIHRYLDFPDMASLACPKPMLFFNGRQDRLFPEDSTLAAFEKMRRIWESQKAADRLVTRMWDVPHLFDLEMQDAAFAWLDTWLRSPAGGKRYSVISNPAQALRRGELLHSDDFNAGLGRWTFEQQPGGTVIARDGRLIIEDQAGCTVWFRSRLQAPVVISYTTILSGSARVSDLNCFWLATDPRFPNDLFADGHGRTGRFRTYDNLLTYYVGYGGNGNTTTRFRRYDGSGARPLLPEHNLTHETALLKPDHPYRIELIAGNGRAQFIRDGEVIFDFADPAPLTTGWFGFRTVKSRIEISDFRVWRGVDFQSEHRRKDSSRDR